MDDDPGASRKAIFLDRDGVLNRDDGYVHRVEDLILLPRVGEALRELRTRGFLLVVVSNQAGVARGYFGLDDVARFNDALQARLTSEFGVRLDDFYFCPFHPQGTVAEFARESHHRKPAPGMILDAIARHGIARESSYLVGDKHSDVESAVRAGVRAIQVLAGSEPRHVGALGFAESLHDALPLLR